MYSATPDGDRLEVDAELEADGDGRERVADVVETRRVEDDPAQTLGAFVDVEVRRGGDLLDVLGAQRRLTAGAVGADRAVNAAQDGPHVLVVQAQDGRAEERDRVGELDERVLDVLEVAVDVEVVGLDVGHHRDDGRQLQERPVVLVGLDDDELAGARRRRWSRTRPPCHRR